MRVSFCRASARQRVVTVELVGDAPRDGNGAKRTSKAKCGTLLADLSIIRRQKLRIAPSEVLQMTVTSRVLVLLTTLLLLCAPARAVDWPTKSVTIIVPFGAGGNTDMMARLAAQHLTEKFGQPFVVENRPGAGGALGTGAVATAAPDGYTLLFSAAANIVLTPQVQKLNFDPLKQLVPITNVGTGTQMVAINNDLPVKTLPEFIAYAKANPGKLNFSVAGTNNISHLAPVLLFARAGIELVMVPAKSEPLAIADIIAGQTNFYFGNSSSLLPQVRAGKAACHRGRHGRTHSRGARGPSGRRYAARLPVRVMEWTFGSDGHARRHHVGDRQGDCRVRQIARDIEAPVRSRDHSRRPDEGAIGSRLQEGLRILRCRRQSRRHRAAKVALSIRRPCESPEGREKSRTDVDDEQLPVVPPARGFHMRRRDFIRLAAGAAIALPATARAQFIASRPITMIVPFPAGGGADILVRILTKYMSENLEPHHRRAEHAGSRRRACLRSGRACRRPMVTRSAGRRRDFP